MLLHLPRVYNNKLAKKNAIIISSENVLANFQRIYIHQNIICEGVKLLYFDTVARKKKMQLPLSWPPLICVHFPIVVEKEKAMKQMTVSQMQILFHSAVAVAYTPTNSMFVPT